jgi:small subunit ribosomal protein S14
MSKVGRINKMQNVERQVKNQTARRAALKAELAKARTGELDFATTMVLQEQLNKMPRNGSALRLHNICKYDGRPRGFMRKFGMNRVLFRKLASEGQIPGIVKAS